MAQQTTDGQHTDNTQTLPLIDWVNPSKRGETNGFQGLTGLLRRISQGRSPMEIPRSSPLPQDIFNRRGCSTNTFVINWFGEWSFSSKYSKHHNSQTARELKFWENVHPTPSVMCHVSHVSVTCHMSHVTCCMSCVTCYLWIFVERKIYIYIYIYIYFYICFYIYIYFFLFIFLNFFLI